MMQTKNTQFARQIRSGWLLLAGGALLMLIGWLLGRFAPAVQMNTKLIIALGLVLAGGAGGTLVKYLTARRYAEAAREVKLEQTDERRRMIRAQAGSKTFEITIAFSCLALLVYSFTSAHSTQFDPLWAYLAFMVVAPLAVYIAFLIHYDRRF
jgi:uncharacterized membrane protein